MTATIVALLHFDGTDGSTDFPDPTGNVWSATDFVVSTAQSQFGGASGVSSLGQVSTPDSAPLRIVGDITIDCWLRFNTLPTDDFGANLLTKNSYGLFVTAEPDGSVQYLQFYWTDSVGDPQFVQVPWTPTTDTWIHVEFDRAGGDGYFFVDGVQVGGTQTVAGDFFDSTGADLRTEGLLDGYIDELRLCDGADHTSDFTPPTEAYTAGPPPITGDAAFASPLKILDAEGLVDILGQGAFSTPLKTLISAGNVPPVGIAEFILPTKLLASQGRLDAPNSAAWYLPLKQVTGTGLVGVTGRMLSALPTKTLFAHGGNGSDITLPMKALFAAGAVGVLGRSTSPLPTKTLVAAGIVNVVGNAAFALPLKLLQARAAAGVIGTLRVALPLPQMAATGVTGVVGTAILPLPLKLLQARMVGAVTGAAVFTLPMPRLEALGWIAVTENFRAWALNLKNRALTEYVNFRFNSFAVWNDMVLAAGPDGLFVLDQVAADNGAEINVRLRTGQFDLGSSFTQRLDRAYMNGTFAGDIHVTTKTVERGDHTYLLAQNGRTGLQQRPLKIGKGVRSRYLQLEIQNVEGSAFDLHNIVIPPHEVKRRIQ